MSISHCTSGMHDLFEAKWRHSGGTWSFLEGAVSPLPWWWATRGSGVMGSANTFWCILSSKIASGDNFLRLFSLGEKVEMVHFDAFWNMLILTVCLIIENHRKYPTLEWTGIEPLESAIIFLNVRNIERVNFLKVLWQVARATDTALVGRIPAVHVWSYSLWHLHTCLTDWNSYRCCHTR